jgi:RimJ/RimL family protein N-acetyltransferase
MSLAGTRVYLRKLTLDDVSDAYVGWLNDPVTNRFMETRWTPHTRADVAAFVADKLGSESEHLFGIFLRDGDRHIGNLKVGPVNVRHRTADISYFIGEASARGGGHATEAVALGVRFGFEMLDLEKLSAGVYAANTASARVLERNGFVVEGTRRSQVVFEGRRMDAIEYGRVRSPAERASAEEI